MGWEKAVRNLTASKLAVLLNLLLADFIRLAAWILTCCSSKLQCTCECVTGGCTGVDARGGRKGHTRLTLHGPSLDACTHGPASSFGPTDVLGRRAVDLVLTVFWTSGPLPVSLTPDRSNLEPRVCRGVASSSGCRRAPVQWPQGRVPQIWSSPISSQAPRQRLATAVGTVGDGTIAVGLRVYILSC